MANGVNTDNIDPVAISDEVLVNRDGSTGRQKTVDLATQLAGTGAVADKIAGLETSGQQLSVTADDHETRLSSVEATQTTNMIYATAWVGDLADIVPAYIGQGAEIVDEAGGSHIDPSTGQSVLDAGRYKSYGTAVGAWTRISSTGLGEKADRADMDTATVIWCEATVVGTTLTLTPLSGQNEIEKKGVRLAFISPITSDGINIIEVQYAGQTRQLLRYNGGYNIALTSGSIKFGYPAVIRFDLVAGISHYRIESDAMALEVIGSRIVAVTAVTYANGVYNLTSEKFGNNGQAMFWVVFGTVPDQDVSIRFNGGAAYPLRYAANARVGADDLDATTPHMICWKGAPSNSYHVIGFLPKKVADLSERVSTLEVVRSTKYETEAEALCNKIIGPTFGGGRRYANNPRDPKAFINYVNGVRSLDDPLPFKILNCGCSINTGAGAQDDGASNPGLVLSNMLAARFGAQHNIDVQYESVAVGGTVVSEFIGQLQGATMQDPDIVIGANPKNNATVAALHQLGPQTIYDQYVALIRHIRDNMGAMPIIMGTYHEHTHVDVAGFPDHYQSTWPVLSYNVVNQSATFDQATKRITMFGLASYGQMLQDGSGELPASKLRVTITGEAEFTVTVAAINWATSEITTVEDLAYDGTFTASVKQLPVDEAQLLWDTPAPLLVRKVRSPGGEALLGWYHDDVVNQIVYDACRDEGCGYLDMQRWQYGFLSDAWRTGNYTDETLFNVMFEKPVNPLNPDGPTFVEFNHANQQSYASFNNAMFTPFCSAIEYRRLYAQREF